MTTSRSVRGLAALAAGSLLWGVGAGPAAADTIRDGQWALKNFSAAEKVWPVSQGEGVVVAVIDSGVADHPDLAGQVLPGTDFTKPGGDGRTDTTGHGTGMASVIAGRGHGDNAGVMGLAPKAKILPVKIHMTTGTTIEAGGSNAELGQAIRYAVDHDAKVINMSFVGGGKSDEGYQDAINYAIQRDVVLVAGSGNDPSLEIAYPAAFPGVVVVTGVGESGDLWPKSTTGSQVTLAAPGDNIYRVNEKQGYSTGTGTSDAAAFVSATAALVRSKYPNLSAGQVINRMTKSAFEPKGKGPFPNKQYGYGIVSPSGSLAANPAVDNGPKENPLLNRPGAGGSTSGSSKAPSTGATDPGKPPASGGDSNSPQASSGSKSSNGMLIAVGGGVVGLIVIVVIVLLVRRSKNGNGGGPGGPAGPGGPGGGPGYGYPPQQPGQGYGQQPGQGYPPQAPYPQQQTPYPPQQPPAGGNPYQR
ncbi:type VII secretion-associated serine protease mycosin [Kitasatospora sp. NPDC048407]|uniref:type VII secretion-associated serine protease mycosin n=1 Tax=Kitasatospora sp. NPDC048407 TaxID=3364051 RepID=UPI00371DC535